MKKNLIIGRIEKFEFVACCHFKELIKNAQNMYRNEKHDQCKFKKEHFSTNNWQNLEYCTEHIKKKTLLTVQILKIEGCMLKYINKRKKIIFQNWYSMSFSLLKISLTKRLSAFHFLTKELSQSQ